MKKYLPLLLFCVSTLISCVSQTAVRAGGGAIGGGTIVINNNRHIKVQSIQVTPANLTFQAPGDRGYTAIATLSNGQLYNVTGFVTWGTSNNAIAALGILGTTKTIHCASAGTAEISAVYGGIRGTTHVNCTGAPPPAPTLQALVITPNSTNANVGQVALFTAQGSFSDGTNQNVTNAQGSSWASSDSTIARIETRTSQQPVTCLKAGTVTISETIGGITGTATLVCNATLASIAVKPATATVTVGTSQAFTATGTYTDGSSKDLTSSATWVSSDLTVASPNPSVPSTFNCIKVGTVNITGSVGTVTNTSTLNCSSAVPGPKTLGSIVVTPNTPSVLVGSSIPLTAQGSFSDGTQSNVSAATGAVWSTGTPAHVTLQLPDAIVGLPYSTTLTGSGPTPFDWRAPSCNSPPGTVDVLDWMLMPLPDRNNFHLTGGLNPRYVHEDAGLIWQMKSATGNPWDGNLYDCKGVYLWFTDNNDADQQAACQLATGGPCFSDAMAYKMSVTPKQLAPRFVTVGQGFTIMTPATLQSGSNVNPFIRTTNCGVDNQALKYLGNVKMVGSWPTLSWGGSVGTALTLEIDYFYSGNASGVYVNRERFYFVLGFGWVGWDHAALQSGVYVIDQTSTNNNKIAGGPPNPNFACGVPPLPIVGGLPPGAASAQHPQLNLVDSMGNINGTPVAAGSSSFIVQQRDNSGAYHLQNQTISVNQTAGTASQTAQCIAPGPSVVTITIGAVSASATVTCTTPAPTLFSIQVTPPNQTQFNGSSVPMTATGTYSDGSQQNITSASGMAWSSAVTTVASIGLPGNPQNVNCLMAGTSAITATLGLIHGTTNVMCIPPPVSATGMDAYCTVGDVCNFGGNDGPAVLPQSGYYTDPSVWFTPGTVRTVTTAGTLTSTIPLMQCGDTTVLNGPISGQFTLPSLHCDPNHYWRITGFGSANLPSYGAPVSPCYAGVSSLPGYVNPDGSSIFPCPAAVNQMPVMTSTRSNGTGAFWKVPSGGMSYGIIDSAVYTRTAGTGLITDLLLDTSTGGQWDHVIIYHNWAQGTPGDDTNRALVLNRGTFIAVINNFGSEFHCLSGSTGQCTDAKFVGGGTNTNATDVDHAWKIVGNVAASAAQGILFGGGAASIIPYDIEIRRNWWFKPPSWNPSCTIALCGAAYNGGIGGAPYIVKNAEELKTGNRILYESNKMTNVWPGFSQVGEAITLTPKNQSGTLCPICAVTNITHRFELVESAWQLLQIVNTTDTPGVPGSYAAGGNHYSIHDILGVNMQAPQTNPAGSCCSAAMMTLNTDPSAPANDIVHDVDVNHIGFIPWGGGSTSPPTTSLYSGNMLGSGGALAPNQMMNIKWHNDYFPVGYFGGFTNSSGSTSSCANNQIDATGMISACWPGASVAGNMILPPLILRTNPSIPQWPAGTCRVLGGGAGSYGGLTGIQAFNQTFVNYNNGSTTGDFHIASGSPCKNAGDDGSDPGPDVDQLNKMLQGVGFTPTNIVVTNNWVQVATPAGATQIRSFEINPINNHMYLVDRLSGFWISTTNPPTVGSWTQRNSGLAATTGWTINYDGTHNQLVLGLLAVSGVVHMYTSPNEGATWTPMTLPFTLDSIPAYTGSTVSGNGNLIGGGFFAAGGTCGTFFSANAGVTNTATTCPANGAAPAPGGAHSYMWNPITNDLWMGTEQNGPYRSTNNGTSFAPCGPPDQNFAGGIRDGNLDSLTYDTAGNILFSAQGGVWKQSTTTCPYAFLNVLPNVTASNGRALGRDNNGNIYWGHSKDAGNPTPVFRSTDGGNTWAPFATGLPTLLEAWRFIFNTNDFKMYVNLQDGSTNTGTIWKTQ